MKQTQTLSPLYWGVAFLFAGFANAQLVIQVAPGDVKIKGIEMEAQKTPSFQAGDVSNKKVSRPKEWLELEVEFEVKARAPKDAVLPELLLRYYIGIVDENTKQPVVLTGDVTHLNVLIGEPLYSAVYVPPATMGKLTNDFRSVNKNSVKAYGVEVLYNGVLVGLWSSTGSGAAGKFWEGKPISQGVLSREKTPFGILWIDRYPEIKVK